MDATWAAILVGVLSSVITAAVTGAVSFAALRSWMARREERETVVRETVNDHEARIRSLERRPFDFVTR